MNELEIRGELETREDLAPPRDLAELVRQVKLVVGCEQFSDAEVRLCLRILLELD